MNRRLLICVLIVMAVLPAAAQQPLPPPQAVPRAMYVVDSTADAVDNNIGNGTCATAAGTCTLRAAVQEANSVGSAHIQLSAALYLTSIAGGDDAAAVGDLDITGRVRISGVASGSTTISNGAGDRVFDIRPGGALFLDNVTVSNGTATTPGGCIAVNTALLTLDFVRVANCSSTNLGGGVYVSNGSWVEIRDSQFNSNSALSGGGLSSQNIADQSTSGTMIVERSLFLMNSSSGGFGGAIVNIGQDLFIRNSTFVGNSAGSGGAIAFLQTVSATVVIEHTTIVGNSATTGGGFTISSSSVLLTLRNSIVAGNAATVGPDCKNTIVPPVYYGEGVNFIGDTTDCAAENIGAVVLTGDPKLLLLNGYGGANGLDSMVPDADSPVVDSADPAYCLSIDQRAVSRPQNGTCDLGAVERVSTSILSNGGFEPAAPGGPCVLAPWTTVLTSDKAVKENPYTGECALRFKAQQGKAGKATFRLAWVKSNSPEDEVVYVNAMVRTTPNTSATIKVKVTFVGGATTSEVAVLGNTGSIYELVTVNPIRPDLVQTGVAVKKVLVMVTSTGSGKWYLDDASATQSSDGTN